MKYSELSNLEKWVVWSVRPRSRHLGATLLGLGSVTYIFMNAALRAHWDFSEPDLFICSILVLGVVCDRLYTTGVSRLLRRSGVELWPTEDHAA
jgi:hypothetical protein